MTNFNTKTVMLKLALRYLCYLESPILLKQFYWGLIRNDIVKISVL
jgi:hypothetical protein